MKSNFISAIRLTLVCAVFFIGIYSIIIFSIAQIAPNKGKGIKIENKYYENIGQTFDKDEYFNSRPSAVAYNAASSCGSNKGPSNPDYLKEVNARIDTFLVHNPGIKKSEIPSELVTASGSGLDPNISINAAKIQVKRISKIRNISEMKLLKLIQENVEKRMLNSIGVEKINVLKLNLALNKIAKK
jgi:K+-transporting ATPase ATPase C chain